MSRTNAHVPLHVRIARADVTAVERHDHRFGVCDLPDRALAGRSWRRTTACFRAWVFDGTRVCPCEMCHGGGANRAERRRSRHDAAVEARAAARRWNGGDRALD